jgi:hypothetical protein
LVNVCLLDASGRRLLDSVDLEAGQSTRTFRSKRFRVAFGNGQIRMRINGKVYGVPDRPDPIGFLVSSGRRLQVVHELPARRDELHRRGQRGDL